MPLLPRVLTGLLLLLTLPLACRADLFDYLKRPEPAFAWKFNEAIENPRGTIYDLQVVSQEWQGITWKHQVQIYRPKGVEFTSTILLWNQGGQPSQKSVVSGMTLAEKVKSPVVYVYGIPNQPLLGNRVEDDLISETFVNYLKTKDETWPLLFPMVKSLVKCMDAVQAFAKQEVKFEIKQFVVSGASKRGWTSWLTGASDPRVKAIAPLVIDTLNMKSQGPHQKMSYGDYSEQIDDYTKKGLVPIPDVGEAVRLWSMVDPWTYREKLKLPKMIINGGNDAYWSVDSLNLYWDDLPGDKWVTYVPNAGHNLEQQLGDGMTDRSRAVNTLAVFARSQIFEEALPKVAWTYNVVENNQVRLAIESDRTPKAARLWRVQSATRDFRKSPWSAIEGKISGNSIVLDVPAPDADMFQAAFGELEFESAGLPHYLSTQMRVTVPLKK